MNWYAEALKKYAVFSGRARRREYWTFTLVNAAVAAILVILFYALGQNVGVSVVTAVFSLAILLPGLAVCVRRLHDTGRSGWFIFLNFIPLVGSIILLVFFCQDSQPGENKYGACPK